MSEMFIDGSVPKQQDQSAADGQTQTAGLVFEDPPAQVHRDRKSAIFTDEVVAALKANAGKWAVLLPEAKQSQVGNTQAWAKRRPGFEVVSRTVNRDSDLPYRVYARFDPSRVEKDQKELDQKAKEKKPKKG